MISYANLKNAAYGVKNLILDTADDIPNLPIDCAAGSIATVISTGDKYISNSKGEWKLYKSADIELILDGGTLVGACGD